MIDTSIIIDYLRKKKKQYTKFYRIVDVYRLYISSVTVFELLAGAKDEQKRRDIDNIIDYLEVLPFTRETAEEAGKIILSLKKNNKIIEAKDLFIAATALSNRLPVMTLNVKHFDRIPGLELI